MPARSNRPKSKRPKRSGFAPGFPVKGFTRKSSRLRPAFKKRAAQPVRPVPLPLTAK